jgi:hypothetical protein
MIYDIAITDLGYTVPRLPDSRPMPILGAELEGGRIQPSRDHETTDSARYSIPPIPDPPGDDLNPDYLRLQQAQYARHLELAYNALIARGDVIPASHVLMFLLKYSVVSELGQKRLRRTSINRREVEREFLRLHHEWQLWVEPKLEAMSDEELDRKVKEAAGRADEEWPETRSIIGMSGQELHEALPATSVEELQ